MNEDKNSTPLITVIIPVYKVEETLRKCVISVCNQSYKNLEIILVDDGSPDDCPEICDDLAKTDSRIKVIHKANAGVSEARNSGLSIAEGEYIGFVDSDDWIEPDMFEKLLSPLLKYPEVSVTACGWVRHEGEKEIRLLEDIPGGMMTGREAFRSAVRGNGIEGFSCNKLYRSSLLSKQSFKFDSSVSICEDLLFNCQLLLKVDYLFLIPECLYHYIIHDNSAVTSYQKRDSEVGVRRRIIELVQSDRELYYVSCYSFLQGVLSLTYHLHKTGNNENAKIILSERKGYLFPSLRSNVGLKGKIKILFQYCFPYMSVDFWFFLKKMLKLERFTNSVDR